jgi:hypothetical protein
MLLDDTVLYMRFPVLAGGGSGKPWLKMDLENLSRQAGTPLEQFGQLSQGDPTQTLKYLRAAGDFEALGSDRVRGIETTHYKGTIDLRKVLGEVDGPQQEQLERLLDQSGVSTVPAEAWIDGEGYLRKLTALGLTMELYDFGAPVALDLPSEDEVTDLTELAGTGS